MLNVQYIPVLNSIYFTGKNVITYPSLQVIDYVDNKNTKNIFGFEEHCVNVGDWGKRYPDLLGKYEVFSVACLLNKE